MAPWRFDNRADAERNTIQVVKDSDPTINNQNNTFIPNKLLSARAIDLKNDPAITGRHLCERIEIMIRAGHVTMKIETARATGSQAAYGELIAIAMRETQTSARHLEKTSGVSRLRIASIIRNGDATRTEQHSIFTALGIDSLRAYLAIDQLCDPSAYFGAIAETVANFAQQFTTQLEKQCESREGLFKPIRRNLLIGLVKEVTNCIIKHQDLSDLRSEQFLGGRLLEH
jgi:hypothetical protein